MWTDRAKLLNFVYCFVRRFNCVKCCLLGYSIQIFHNMDSDCFNFFAIGSRICGTECQTWSGLQCFRYLRGNRRFSDGRFQSLTPLYLMHAIYGACSYHHRIYVSVDSSNMCDCLLIRSQLRTHRKGFDIGLLVSPVYNIWFQWSGHKF